MHDFPPQLTCLQTSAEWTERKKVTYGLKLHHLRQTSNQSELFSFLFILVPFLKNIQFQKHTLADVSMPGLKMVKRN